MQRSDIRAVGALAGEASSVVTTFVRTLSRDWRWPGWTTSTCWTIRWSMRSCATGLRSPRPALRAGF